jgi:hypothetical protein
MLRDRAGLPGVELDAIHALGWPGGSTRGPSVADAYLSCCSSLQRALGLLGDKPGRHALWIERLNYLFNAKDPIVRIGVCAKEFGRPARIACGKNLHDLDHCTRVIALVGHDLHPKGVSLEFIIPPVFHVDQLANQDGHLSELLTARILGIVTGNKNRTGYPLGKFRLRDLFGAVSRQDVDDLVRQDTCQLALCLDPIDQGACNEHLPTR